MLDNLNMLLPAGAVTTAAKKAAKKLSKKSKKDRKIPRIFRQTKADSTENVSSKMKATASDATPPADKKDSSYTKGLRDREMEIKKGIPSQEDMDKSIKFEEKGKDIPRPKRKPPVPAKVVKKAKGGKVSSGYKCSHNRLY